MEKSKFEEKESNNNVYLPEGEELKLQKFLIRRKQELKQHRKNVRGVNIDDIWEQAEKRYIPHKLKFANKKKTLVSDDEKGWRSSLVELGGNDWQNDDADIDLFVKIQIVISILSQKLPKAVFKSKQKKYEKFKDIIKAVYYHSWGLGGANRQFKLFLFNVALYGFGVMRTYPKIDKDKVKVLKSVDENGKKTYEEKEVTNYNDVYRESLNPKRVWVDDKAKPNTPDSERDWMFEVDYTDDILEKEFGDEPNYKYLQPASKMSNSAEGESTDNDKQYEEPVHTLTFYENKIKDIFCVFDESGLILKNEPLPMENPNGSKRLSLSHTYWNLRDDNTIEGIGLYEIIRNDSVLYDKLNNMTVDQLVLSIYKMFFYAGTNQIDSTGEMKLSPGVGRQVSDPKNIQFVDIPGPGPEAWKGLDFVQNRKDEITGITKPLSAQLTNEKRTAYEVGQAKESALQRLTTPLENIKDALERDAYNALSVMSMIYSVPEAISVTDTALIKQYLEETQGDSDLFERGEDGDFIAKIYRELPINLDFGKDGKLMESKETRFFRIKPEVFSWEGVIDIQAESIVTPSPLLERQETIEMSQILIPLLAQDPSLVMKPAKEILKQYDKDPEDWLPDAWLNAGGEQPVDPNGLFVPQGNQGAMPPEGSPVGSPALGGKMLSNPSMRDGRQNSIVKQFSNAIKPV